jgi:hypothetical protein
MRPFRPVAQEHDWGSGAACVAAVLGVSYREVVAKLGKPGKNGNKDGKPGKTKPKAPSGEALRRVLNEALAGTGLVYEADRPFIGDPDSLETGSIVALDGGRYLVRAEDGWMDPSKANVRKRLPGAVHQAFVLTPAHE